MHEDIIKVAIKRGVIEGDIISPKVLVLEYVVKNLLWVDKGVNISRERLNN